MYTVKIISNTVSENLERLIGFYIDEVMQENPSAKITFQYQALNGINETIYSCMVTVQTSIIQTHYMPAEDFSRDAGAQMLKALTSFFRGEKEVGSAGMQPASDIHGAG